MCARQPTGTISAGSEGLTGRGNLFTVLFSVGDRKVAHDLIAEAFCPGVGVLADGQEASGDANVGGPHRAEPEIASAAMPKDPSARAGKRSATSVPSELFQPVARGPTSHGDGSTLVAIGKTDRI